jgi:ubiquinone/menaquinone biosynthesis C-methylase UbiE
MHHIDKLCAFYEVGGRTVADIGAGDGGTAREMAALGATVTGIEISPEKVAAATAKATPGTTFLLGRAEALPLPDASQDLACMFFSLHHVPQDVQDGAFTEVQRILKPGGRLHVAEPLPHGALSEVVKIIDDETYVRTESQARLDRLAAGQVAGFKLIAREEYDIVRRYTDFEALVRRMVMIDPVREARLPEIRDELHRRFLARATWQDDHYALTQPCVMYHFELVD